MFTPACRARSGACPHRDWTSVRHPAWPRRPSALRPPLVRGSRPRLEDRDRNSLVPRVERSFTVPSRDYLAVTTTRQSRATLRATVCRRDIGLVARAAVELVAAFGEVGLDERSLRRSRRRREALAPSARRRSRTVTDPCAYVDGGLETLLRRSCPVVVTTTETLFAASMRGFAVILRSGWPAETFVAPARCRRRDAIDPSRGPAYRSVSIVDLRRMSRNRYA